jgi:hypothetical protein
MTQRALAPCGPIVITTISPYPPQHRVDATQRGSMPIDVAGPMA